MIFQNEPKKPLNNATLVERASGPCRKSLDFSTDAAPVPLVVQFPPSWRSAGQLPDRRPILHEQYHPP